MVFSRLARAIAVAGLASGLALTAAAAPAYADRSIPPPVPGDVLALVPDSGWSGQDKKCVEVRDRRTDDFAPVVQYSCHYGDNQRWRLGQATADPNVVYLQNIHSGRCLEVVNYSVNYGAPTGQYSCHLGTNQQWRMLWNDYEGYAQFQNVNSGLCLSVDGFSTANFTAIVQNRCYATFSNEQFIPEFFQ